MSIATNPYATARKSLRGFFGRFPQVTKIDAQLQTLKDYHCEDEEPECLALIGQTGTGKTTLLRAFARRFPRIEREHFTEVPVLYLEVPSNCTIKRLAGFMLQTLGTPFWNHGDEEGRTNQLLTLLKGCNVRVVVLDEVNHLADRGAAKTHYQIGDWIKQLSRKSAVPIVLAGTPSASILWETNEQLADRYEVVTVEPLSLEPHRIRELRSVLLAFQRLMNGLNVVDLTDERNCRSIVFATAGRLRDIRKLFVRAVDLAQSEQCLDITRSTLARAFAQVIYPNAAPKRNPFDDKFDGLPLTGAGEPFAARGYRK